MPQAAAIPKADPTAPRGPRGQPSQLPPSHNEPAPAPKTFLRANRRSPTPSITPKPLDNGMCRRSGAIKRQPFPSRGQGRISPLGGTRRGSDPNSQGPTTRRAQLLRSEMAGAGPMDNSWRTLTLPHPLPGADFSSLLFFCSDRKQSYSIAHDIGTLSREASQSLTSATQLQQLPHYRDLRRGMGARAGDRRRGGVSAPELRLSPSRDPPSLCSPSLPYCLPLLAPILPPSCSPPLPAAHHLEAKAPSLPQL